ncbi:hypothetical protein [Roseibium marinum]|uniref:Uncharacterized protein n=1 Tax=Roseibium marinum TaxID=281252 RepID=A0A2S3UX81_9HYPH|nr:hypothetical protein [Roseibium marinum]POF32284.1 hypothetical protein CLV41_103207 [Roseibium marinum]
MAEIEFSEAERQHALVLIIHNEKPLDASEIANVLRDLNTDYKRLTGSRLVLARFETGSSGFLIYDYLILAGRAASAVTGIATATGHMSKFAAWLRSLFKGTQAAKEVQQAASAETPISAKTVERLAKLAIKHGVGFEFSHDAAARKTAFRVTPSEAIDARKRMEERQRLHSGQERIDYLSSPHSGVEVEAFAQRVISDASSGRSFDQIENLVEAFVEFMKANGNSYQLPQLAMSFAMQGRSEIADIVRRHINNGPDTISQNWKD